MSDHQCAGSLERAPAPLHAQDLLLNSSSWVGQVPNFRQEIRQTHYRNDPVKYDLVRRFPSPLLQTTKSESRLEKGIARTQNPTNKNYALELLTFETIVGVSSPGVQWTGLTLGEPPS